MENQDHFKSKHLLSIDYGRKVTGFANYRVGSDPFILLYGRHIYKDDLDLVAKVHEIVEEEFIDAIVLGIPFFTDGTHNKMTKIVLDFASKLKEKVSIPIYTQDESLSSYEAEQRMQNDPRFNFKIDLSQIDALAASIIMEEFLKRSSFEKI